MNEEGPQLETLTRRLSECPPEFLGDDRVIIAAVVSDLLRDLGGEVLTREQASAFGNANITGQEKRLRIVMIACWLLHDDWFLQNKKHNGLLTLLKSGLTDLSELVQPEKFVTNADRREEFARVCLKGLGLRPHAETFTQAQDRLATLNSVERVRVIQEAKAAEERARAIREEMARKAAEEAASYYGRD